jgi:hypothetical protein
VSIIVRVVNIATKSISDCNSDTGVFLIAD